MEQSPTVAELLTRQFYEWERRGRGWAVWPGPVELEPPFRPFLGHFVPGPLNRDDGQYETGLSRFADSFRRLFGKNEKRSEPVLIEEPEEPQPEIVEGRRELIELQTLLPADLDISREAFEQFLVSLSLCRQPVSFELLGLASQTSVQFAVQSQDAALVQQQLAAFFPEAVFLPSQTLASTWANGESAIVEFGLGKEFMFRLASGKLDPFVGIIGALAGLKNRELGLVQVIFQRVRQPWAESTMRAVMDNDGDAFFANAPELLPEARKKVSRPLYAAVVRVATQSEDFDRAWEIARNLAGAFHTFADPLGNELIPLKNDDYPYASHVEDVLNRQSRRSGMLLNTDELIGFVHLPGAAVRSAKLLRDTKKTKGVPEKFSKASGILLGQNVHHGQALDVRLSPNERVRHVHVVGASGTGKSTLLLNLIRQDIENGQGVGVLDPHGDLVEDILGLVPPERVADVVLVDPADAEYSVGFNILSAHSDLEKTLLASDLVSIFQRLSTSWGDQMGSVLQNAILAFLESNTGGTLADMRRFLVDPGYRADFLKTVADPDVVFYWKKTFPQLSGNRSIGPVLTRLETFLSPKSIRYMVSQPVNRLDFGDILDSGKIFLAKLSQGQIGRENAFLLGSLLVSKFQQTAMSRQSMAQETRRDYWLYIDEFHNFITPSMAEILTGARKYRLGLTLAHQELRQLQRDSEVASAVISNPYTRIVFRVGDDDARKLGEGFGFFEAKDLQNLSTGEAIVRVERGDFDFNITVPMLPRPTPERAAQARTEAITVSRKRYGASRAEIEARLRSQAAELAEEPSAPAKPSPMPPQAPLETNPKLHAEVPLPPPVVPSPPVAKSATSSIPAESGRGGAQHTAIQKRLKRAAEELGFHGTIEKEVPGGSVDLVLQRDDLSIACEISFSTTIDHEVGLVINRLSAGFANIAIICIEESRLERIQKAVLGCLSSEQASCVAYYLPEAFIAHLQSLTTKQTGTQPSLTLGKYKVKTTQVSLTDEERKQKEAGMVKIIAETMKKRKRSKK
ncbi:MAG: DUF87 domain-containing protein [Verrucomicrobia bacterium]|nr:DUF87 domain-containing protein [Verrucomicrobiota bacterium]